MFPGDLYLVPFAVLKGASSVECLHERFNLRILPSLKALTANLYWEKRSLSNSGLVPALVVANPKMPQPVMDKWGWGDLPNAEQVNRINSIQIMNVYGCNCTNIFIRWKMKCSIQRGEVASNGTFHLSPNENICSFARIKNIHYSFYITCTKIQIILNKSK